MSQNELTHAKHEKLAQLKPKRFHSQRGNIVIPFTFGQLPFHLPMPRRLEKLLVGKLNNIMY